MIENINFDDFIILTNICKHIAYIISTEAKPVNDDIARILFEKSKENKYKTFTGLKKLKNNNERYEKAIKSYARTNFGRLSDADITDIIYKFKSLLA